MERPTSLIDLDAVRGETTTYPRFQRPAPSELTAEVPTETQDGAWRDEGYRFHRRATKPSKEEFANATRWLHDMVKICTEAHRAGARDLLWMSWLPKAARKSHPTRYSGLIALTAEGARKLMLNFGAWFPKAGHFDCELRDKLCNHTAVRAELSAGYLYPCLGHYSQHESGIEKGVREMDWSQHHILQETRVSEIPNCKHESIGVAAFTAGGYISLLHDGVHLPDTPPDDFRWWTAAITIPEPPIGAKPASGNKSAAASSAASMPNSCPPRACTQSTESQTMG